jgi:L,D-transpeptidase-like protein
VRGRGRAVFVVVVLAWYAYAVAEARPRTHEEVTRGLGARHRPKLQADIVSQGLSYPPPRLTLIGLKEEKLLEVWAPTDRGWWRVRSYAVLAASGGPGPKLRQGDLQVPEGFYRLTAFNPNSRYHLSIRVGYPNRDDEAVARAEGRRGLGGDIYIHGRAVSIGCLAIGDDGIEELYLLLSDVGLARVRLILTPRGAPRARADTPAWVRQLYERLRDEIRSVRGSAG